MNKERNASVLNKRKLIAVTAIAAGVTTVCAPLIAKEVLKKREERQKLEESEQLAGDGCFPFTKESIIFKQS